MSSFFKSFLAPRQVPVPDPDALRAEIARVRIEHGRELQAMQTTLAEITAARRSLFDALEELKASAKRGDVDAVTAEVLCKPIREMISAINVKEQQIDGLALAFKAKVAEINQQFARYDQLPSANR